MLSCDVCCWWQEVGWRWRTGQGAPATQRDIGEEPGEIEDTNKLKETETKAIDDDVRGGGEGGGGEGGGGGGDGGGGGGDSGDGDDDGG